MSLAVHRDRAELIDVITLWQPWASWILWEWKTIETRTHARFAKLEQKRIGIHAGKHFDDAAIETARDWLTEEQIQTTLHYPHQHQAIICTVFVHGAAIVSRAKEHLALIECNTVRHGLFLHSREILNPPITAKGRQGIWKASVPIRRFGD